MQLESHTACVLVLLIVYFKFSFSSFVITGNTNDMVITGAVSVTIIVPILMGWFMV